MEELSIVSPDFPDFPAGWRALGDKLPTWLQQIDRIPNVYKGAGAGGALGAAGAYSSYGCSQ